MPTLIETIVEQLLDEVRPGRAGWRDRARVRLRAEVAQRAQEWTLAASAAKRAEEEARKASEPVWRVVPEMGIYSWSGELYGYSVQYGSGTSTRAEAEAEAETLRLRDAKRIQQARACWAEYMSR